MNPFFLLLPVFLFFFSPLLTAELLSPREQDYLNRLGPVKISVDPDWIPFEQINQNGEYTGIAADLVHLIAERTGISLELVPTVNWNESIVFSQTGKCDVLAFLNQTPLREEWLLFTEPYYTDTNVLITREEHAYISNPAVLVGETIVLPAGTSVEERVRKDYPNLTVIIVDSETEALGLVEARKAHMTLRSLTMAAYTINKEGWFNLKIAGEIPEYANRMRMGVVKDKPLLKDILNKGIRTITPGEIQEIVNRHVPITVATRIDYKVIFQVAGGFSLLLLIGLVWLYQLRKYNRKLVILSSQLALDIAERKKAEEALRESEERYRILIETAMEGILVIQDGKLSYHNPMLTNITGYSTGELLGTRFPEFIHPDDRALAIDNYRKRMLCEDVEQRYRIRMFHKNGKTLWVEVSGTRIEWNGNPAGLNFVTDITQQVEIEQKIRHMAQHDELTKLPNRSLFFDRLQQAIITAKRDKKSLAVMFIDLDQFKPVNDTYGHETGDKVLIETAQRLQKTTRESDTAARIGGDEFIILLPAVESPASALMVGKKIWKEIAGPIQFETLKIKISSSIGIAVFPEHGTTAIELMKNADSAMYRIKKTEKSGIGIYASKPL